MRSKGCARVVFMEEMRLLTCTYFYWDNLSLVHLSHNYLWDLGGYS